MRLKNIFLLAFAALTLHAYDCNAQTDGQPETRVLLKTTAGDIKLKLYNETPIHRDNFIKLVQEHYYDSLLFHRVIRDFMVQAGDPESKHAIRFKELGTGGPDYTLPAEFVYPKLYHKRGALCAARQSDMANPERRSSGSQFYIVTGKTYRAYELRDLAQELDKGQRQNVFDRLCALNRDTIMSLREAMDDDGLKAIQEKLVAEADSTVAEMGPFQFSEEQSDTYLSKGGTPNLDNQYTVFGEVIEGMNVVDKIERASTDVNDRPLKDIRILSAEIIE